MLKTRLGSIPLVAFEANATEPYWRAIFQRQQVPFFEGTHEEVVKSERQLGTSLRPDGAHWDARGHRVAGETLARWLAGLIQR